MIRTKTLTLQVAEKGAVTNSQVLLSSSFTFWTAISIPFCLLS
jgi:hypothetical protein